ncbi:MAG TPA: hypothetical protein VF648_03945 [Pyrinomonadaceae bacterium]|jgi:uncharacterized protein (DUF2461 family)
MAHRPNIRNASIECTKAISALATSPDSLRERLIGALTRGFSFINEKDLSEDLQEDYNALRDRVTAKGNIQATLHEMDEEELREVAAQLLDFAQAVWRESSRQRYQSQ